MEEEQEMNHIVDDKLKLIIGWNKKCGCGSLKHWYIQLKGIERVANAHKQFRRLKFPSTVHENKNYSNYQKVLIIRNPYDRLVSGFLDKYIFSKKTYESLTFNIFVNEFDLPNTSHFELQTSNMRITNWDIISDVHGSDRKLLEISNGYGIKTEVRHLGKLRRKRGYKKSIINTQNVWDMSIDEIKRVQPAYSTFFDSQMRQKVYRIYQKDFEFFQSVGFNYENISD